MRRKWLVALAIGLVLSASTTAHAHAGKTNSKGGHYNHSTGEYHYHHGYPAHFHRDMDGDGRADCPYDFDNKTGQNSGSGGSGNGGSAISPTTYKVNSAVSDNAKPKKTVQKTLFIVVGVLLFYLLLYGPFLIGLFSPRGKSNRAGKKKERYLNTSLIEKASFKKGTLYLTFRDGQIFAYYNAPESLYKELVNSSSADTVFHQKIENIYPYSTEKR